MATLRKSVGIAVIGALLATSAAPAFARGGHGGGHSGWGNSGWGNSGWGGGNRWGRGGRGWGRHHDRVDAGDVIAGVVILGTIAAIASAASKSSRDRTGDRGPGGSYPGGSRSNGGTWGSNSSDRVYGEDSAVDACASAAEDEASRNGRSAKVEDITNVARDGEGYRVEGIVSVARGHYDDKSAFVCGTRDGRVDYVRINDGDNSAWR